MKGEKGTLNRSKRRTKILKVKIKAKVNISNLLLYRGKLS